MVTNALIPTGFVHTSPPPAPYSIDTVQTMRRLLEFAAIAAISLPAWPVIAATTNATQSPEEVVVTARRQPVPALATPLSLDRIDGDDDGSSS